MNLKYRAIFLLLMLPALAFGDQQSEPAIESSSVIDSLQSTFGLDADTVDSEILLEFPAVNDSVGLEHSYQKAIELREKGKWRALIFRKRIWNNSEKHFIYVIKQDSLYRDVLYQYALLLRYRKDYERAIRMCHTQMNLRPELTPPRVNIYAFYRKYISHTDADECITWLKSLPWDQAKHAMVEKYRREGRDASADTLLSVLIDDASLNMPVQPVYLSLAKLYYEREEPRIAENFFNRALDNIRTHVDADIVFEEYKYIVTDGELRQYRSIPRASGKREFFKKFWVKRNPLPSHSYNKRLTEHFRRLRYAERYYEFDGFRGYFNNPDKLTYLKFTSGYALNEEYNDKGLIYIRHGEPDDIISTLGETVPYNESWRYNRLGNYPEMTFHFALENSPGLWRVTPVIEHPKMLEDRFQWGSQYYSLLRSNALEKQSLLIRMADKTQISLTKGLSSDRHTWKKEMRPLSFPFLVSTFRGKNGTSVVDVYSELPVAQIAEHVKRDVTISKGFTIHDMQWSLVRNEREVAPLSIKNLKRTLNIHSSEVRPGTYHFALNVIPEKTNLIGGYKFRTDIVDFSGSELSLSDILLADKIGPVEKGALLVKNDLAITPNIRGQFSKKNPAYIYYEIYQLQMDENGKVSFYIEYKMTLTKKRTSGLGGLLNIFGKGKSSITTRVDCEGLEEFSAEYLSFDVSRLKSGEYELEIRVQDQLSGESVTKTQKLELK